MIRFFVLSRFSVVCEFESYLRDSASLFAVRMLPKRSFVGPARQSNSRPPSANKLTDTYVGLRLPCVPGCTNQCTVLPRPLREKRSGIHALFRASLGSKGSSGRHFRPIELSHSSDHKFVLFSCFRLLLGRSTCQVARPIPSERTSAHVFRLVNMCQMIVAMRRITATLAIFDPRFRFSFLNHARIAGSVRRMCFDAWPRTQRAIELPALVMRPRRSVFSPLLRQPGVSPK